MKEADWKENIEQILETIAGGVMVLNPGGCIVFANASAERIFVCKRSDLIGHIFNDPVWKLTTPDGKPLKDEDRPFHRVMRTGKPVYGIEISGRRPDGIQIIMSFNAVPLYDEKGALAGVVETFTDITERKLSEEALRESEERFRLLSESTFEGIVIHDKGRILEANKTLAGMFGYELDELIGRSGLDLLTPESREIVLQHILSGSEEPYEAVGIKKDGTHFPVEIRPKTTTYKGCTVRVGAIRDMTEHKLTEKALRETGLAIRKAYVDVISAVTGGRLIIATLEEVKASLGEPIMDSCRIVLEDLAATRARLREIIRHQFPNLDIENIIIAAGEAITNAIKHAGGGEYRIYKAGKAAQILISDYGPGIDFETLPRATLVTGFSTKPSLGLGFTMMLELTDRIMLSTRPGNTIIVLEKL